MTKSMSDETQNTCSRDLKTPAARRKGRQKTRAEIDALEMRKLRDEFGNSPLALNEPELDTVPAGAVECAIKMVKKSLRSNKGFEPNAVAKRAAQVCGLTHEMESLIRDWLDWLKIRTWVLSQPNRSPVIAWLNTKPCRDEKWSQALHDQWVEQINASWRKIAGDSGTSSNRPKKAASRQASAVAGPEALVLASNVSIPRSQGTDSDPSIHSGEVEQDSITHTADHVCHDLFDQSPQQQSPRPGEQKQSPSQLPPAKENLEPRNLDIPPVEPKYFRKGQWNLNKFFNAIKAGPEPQIRAAAQILADDPQIFEEICSVSQDHRRFVDAVFAALGMSIPGSDR